MDSLLVLQVNGVLGRIFLDKEDVVMRYPDNTLDHNIG